MHENIIFFFIFKENIALFKTTWQKHPWPNPNRDFGSENAVDGMYSDRGTVSQCTINDVGYYTAEWRVDLGRVFSISYIKIFYRTDNSISMLYLIDKMSELNHKLTTQNQLNMKSDWMKKHLQYGNNCSPFI